ncbi:MAG: hypothetical protein PHQ23_07595 [Candidatus Wallbacteria bacterium]|nr:hypothetical protein [Candidatus Wallbacteria bacterium]
MARNLIRFLIFTIFLCLICRFPASAGEYCPFDPPFDQESGPYWPGYVPYDPSSGPCSIFENITLFDSLGLLSAFTLKLMEQLTNDTWLQKSQEVHLRNLAEIKRESSTIGDKIFLGIKSGDFSAYKALKQHYKGGKRNERKLIELLLERVYARLISILPSRPDLREYFLETRQMHETCKSLTLDWSQFPSDSKGLITVLSLQINRYDAAKLRIFKDEGDRRMYLIRIKHHEQLVMLINHLLSLPL